MLLKIACSRGDPLRDSLSRRLRLPDYVLSAIRFVSPSVAAAWSLLRIPSFPRGGIGAARRTSSTAAQQAHHLRKLKVFAKGTKNSELKKKKSPRLEEGLAVENNGLQSA